MKRIGHIQKPPWVKNLEISCIRSFLSGFEIEGAADLPARGEGAVGTRDSLLYHPNQVDSTLSSKNCDEKREIKVAEFNESARGDHISVIYKRGGFLLSRSIQRALTLFCR
ncbi:MAG: hypothetical protein VYD19_01970 [Myxococcota bacterium]|nr:hypothetical protein [Myxococcota bacterium]